MWVILKTLYLVVSQRAPSRAKSFARLYTCVREYQFFHQMLNWTDSRYTSGPFIGRFRIQTPIKIPSFLCVSPKILLD